jgi:hypothetical protein
MRKVETVYFNTIQGWRIGKLQAESPSAQQIPPMPSAETFTPATSLTKRKQTIYRSKIKFQVYKSNSSWKLSSYWNLDFEYHRFLYNLFIMHYLSDILHFPEVNSR